MREAAAAEDIKGMSRGGCSLAISLSRLYSLPVQICALRVIRRRDREFNGRKELSATQLLACQGRATVHNVTPRLA